ncbi:hypothetical protein SXCC_02084 [Gluconacetobacter sp. SXCC-1]|nr:hypothetical protein SXCC_02084 [Gluconacetobacter sp. SXCC-1]
MAARYVKVTVPYRVQPMPLFSMKRPKRAMPYPNAITKVCPVSARLSHIRDSFPAPMAPEGRVIPDP